MLILDQLTWGRNIFDSLLSQFTRLYPDNHSIRSTLQPLNPQPSTLYPFKICIFHTSIYVIYPFLSTIECSISLPPSHFFKPTCDVIIPWILYSLSTFLSIFIYATDPCNLTFARRLCHLTDGMGGGSFVRTSSGQVGISEKTIPLWCI